MIIIHIDNTIITIVIKSMFYLLCWVSSLTIKVNLIIMEFEQTISVGHCEESYIQFFCFCVKLGFEVHTYCTCAFIKYSKNGSVVEQSSHRNTLFFSSWKNILPVIHWVKASFSVFNILKSDVFQKKSDIVISFSLLLHSGSGVRIDDLIS